MALAVLRLDIRRTAGDRIGEASTLNNIGLTDARAKRPAEGTGVFPAIARDQGSPTDGSPHLPPPFRQWFGDSRGRWEGETLVVDTTNFTDKTAFRGSTASLHLVERFTRIDNDTIVYEFTADDPATWTRSWTAQIQLTRIKGPLFEFACHEGNQGVANTLSGARAVERAAAEAAGKVPK